MYSDPIFGISVHVGLCGRKFVVMCLFGEHVSLYAIHSCDHIV